MLKEHKFSDLDNRKRAHNEQVAEHFDRRAASRRDWLRRNRYFYGRDLQALRKIIPEGARVLEIGCGVGNLLAGLKPSYGLGIDISSEMIEVARQSYPDLHFACRNIETATDLAEVAEAFDFVVMSDLVGLLFDVQELLRSAHRLFAAHTRLVITYYNHWWEPAAALWAKVGMSAQRPKQNWFAFRELIDLLQLENYDVIQSQRRELSPMRLLGLGTLINRYVAPLPLINLLCWRSYIVARSRSSSHRRNATITALIPCRNEKGNIESCVTRMPEMGAGTEILFVEGNSHDGTYEECLRVQKAYPERNIRVLKQTAKGKGDAVRLGFHEAAGDIVVIVDSDLTVPPEYMPRVHEALSSGTAEFVNCSRLVYPMESGAMRPLNFIANRAFAALISYLINQRLSDTLCGTKALFREDYLRIESERRRLGSLDPFGDFDLIFGAARNNLRIMEIPVRYFPRDYGETQISRFRDGWELAKMVWHAFREFKAQ